MKKTYFKPQTTCEAMELSVILAGSTAIGVGDDLTEGSWQGYSKDNNGLWDNY